MGHLLSFAESSDIGLECVYHVSLFLFRYRCL